MAVSLQTADLIQPDGELSASYFPDSDLDDLIDGWLTTAAYRVQSNADIAESAHNDAAEAWVYYLAYSHIANRLSAMPNSVGVGGGEVTQSWGPDRPAYWLRRAAEQRELYAGYIVPQVVNVTPRISMSIPTRVTW